MYTYENMYILLSGLFPQKKMKFFFLLKQNNLLLHLYIYSLHKSIYIKFLYYIPGIVKGSSYLEPNISRSNQVKLYLY